MDAPAGHPGRAVRVLIAEDSPTQAQRLCRFLERNGCVVAVGANGRLALEMAAEFGPEIIVSDVVMPEMDGYELAWHVKADPALRDVPVILVTTMSDARDVIRGLECGADHFVLKPYDESYLLGRIHHLLQNRGIAVNDTPGSPVEVHLNGKRHLVTADRRQILQLLLSTYDAATQRNKELAASQDALRELNRRLDAANVEMANANRFLDSVIDNIPDVLFVKEAAGLRYLRLNRSGQEMLGYSEADVRGKTDAELFPAELAELFTGVDRDVLAGGAVVQVLEETVQSRHGGLRIVRTKKIPIVDAKNQPLYLLGIAEDVTEEKAREREVFQLNAALGLRASELELAYRDLDAFAASVSHDLRAPLRYLDGYAELLATATDGRLSVDAQRYLGIIRKASAHMGDLIDDLLDFARTGRTEMHDQPVDLAEVVASCRSDLELASTGRSFEWQIGSLPVVNGDGALLRQVFVNLLENAVKYTRPRGHACIEVGASIDAVGALTVHVRDNGVGFDMANAERLFGVFQRLHPSEEFEGTGIGLANVRRIIARHGGQTWAESRPDEGATFYFSLPAGTGLEPPAGLVPAVHAVSAVHAVHAVHAAAALPPSGIGPPPPAAPTAGAEPWSMAAAAPAQAHAATPEGLRVADASGINSDTHASAAQVAESTSTSWEAIVAALAPVIGPRGAAALYQRSLHMTARVHPWLASAHHGFQAPLDLEALRVALVHQPGPAAAHASAAHLQCFHKLLVALIGPALAERLLRAGCPDTFPFPSEQPPS